MNYGVLSHFQKKAFWLAVALAVLLHASVMAALILIANGSGDGKYKELAIMDFAYYDPDGGEAGGSDEVEPVEAFEDEPESIDIPEPVVPEPVVPEPDIEPEPEETPEVITTTAEEATPTPTPPPVKKKDTPKPKPAKPKQKAPEEAPSAGQLKPGGGPGDGQGGVGGGADKGNPNALNAYKSKISAKLNRLKKYPSSAQRISGVVTVHFTVDRGGNVISSHIVKSSTHPALDQEAMALLKRCSPFQAMPKELSQNTLSLAVPIQFKAPR